MQPMTLGQIRSAIECDVFAADDEWRRQAREQFGWQPISCREALDWAKTPEGQKLPPPVDVLGVVQLPYEDEP